MEGFEFSSGGVLAKRLMLEESLSHGNSSGSFGLFSFPTLVMPLSPFPEQWKKSLSAPPLRVPHKRMRRVFFSGGNRA